MFSPRLSRTLALPAILAAALTPASLSAPAKRANSSLAPLARIQQGELWTLAVSKTGDGPATVTLLGETHPLFPRHGLWEAPIAIYARTKPGKYEAVVKSGGKVTERVPFQVVLKKYPTQRIHMKKSKTGLMSPAILRKERIILEDAYKKTAPQPLWEGRFILPVSGVRVSSDFGRIRYVNGKFWSQHGGLDLAAPMGRVAVAGNDGRVILARKLWMRGNTLAIDHGMGVISVYNHFSAFLVKEGDKVKKGQPVGKVGATGFVTGPHLHWEIRAAGSPTDPWPLIRKGISLP